MSRKFISLVLAASLAVAGLTAAPARAGNDDLAKVLAGVAAVAVIGAVINENRKDRNDGYVSSRGYGHRNHFDGRGRGHQKAYRAPARNKVYDRTYRKTYNRAQIREEARRDARRDARQDRRARHDNRRYDQGGYSARPWVYGDARR